MWCFQSYSLLEILFFLFSYNLKAYHFIGHFIKKKKKKNEGKMKAVISNCLDYTVDRPIWVGLGFFLGSLFPFYNIFLDSSFSTF